MILFLAFFGNRNGNGFNKIIIILRVSFLCRRLCVRETLFNREPVDNNVLQCAEYGWRKKNTRYTNFDRFESFSFSFYLFTHIPILFLVAFLCLDLGFCSSNVLIIIYHRCRSPFHPFPFHVSPYWQFSAVLWPFLHNDEFSSPFTVSHFGSHCAPLNKHTHDFGRILWNALSRRRRMESCK